MPANEIRPNQEAITLMTQDQAKEAIIDKGVFNKDGCLAILVNADTADKNMYNKYHIKNEEVRVVIRHAVLGNLRVSKMLMLQLGRDRARRETAEVQYAVNITDEVTEIMVLLLKQHADLFFYKKVLKDPRKEMKAMADQLIGQDKFNGSPTGIRIVEDWVNGSKDQEGAIKMTLMAKNKQAADAILAFSGQYGSKTKRIVPDPDEVVVQLREDELLEDAIQLGQEKLKGEYRGIVVTKKDCCENHNKGAASGKEANDSRRPPIRWE